MQKFYGLIQGNDFNMLIITKTYWMTCNFHNLKTQYSECTCVYSGALSYVSSTTKIT